MAGCAGAGAAGAVAALGGFGFFGRIGLRTFGGGAAGWSSANTGLGSMTVVAGRGRVAGIADHLHRNRDRLELGASEGDGEAGVGCGYSTEQGVLQAGPSEVVASAPGGADSSATFTSGGADLKESRENDEQPARLAPVTAIATTRRMIDHSDLRQSATIPNGEP